MLSIVYHELDHSFTTPAQKHFYHRLCDDSCGFKKWLQLGNTAETYDKQTTKDHKGRHKVWNAGVFAGMDTIFPGAFGELVDHFKKIGHPDLMRRCSKIRSTNINESLHSKFHNIAKKLKMHNMERYTFAAQHSVLSHNFGHLAASLLNVFGTMTEGVSQELRVLDRESVRVAKRKHETTATANVSSRKKYNTRGYARGS